MERIALSSPAFQHGEEIPTVFTCEGTNISPPLEWGELPLETKSLALIVEDPDASRGTWVHWVLFNIPTQINTLPENAAIGEINFATIKTGTNDFQALGYGGPCPPSGIHRYFFTLYALDKILELQEGATKKEILEVIEGHVVGKGELIGTYHKKA